METADPDPGRTCPKCGFVWERPGLTICPRCVLSAQCGEGQEGEACLPGEGGFEGERAHLVPGYVIGEVLGRGGCGTVYKATQTALDRPVAIKFLRQDRAVSREKLEALQGESLSLAQLQHPHILSVIDSGEIGGESYIVMEYASGGDLRGLMRDGPVAHEKVVSVIKEAASAVSLAHAEGFVHRDIKPENLLLDRDGRVRVADFGLAASSEASVQAESSVGTPGYMAPEQRGQSDADQIDQRADIYSLGCLAYEMLTGRLPTDEPSPPSGFSGVPKAADAPVLKAMAESRDERYGTADAFANELGDALQDRPRSPRFLWLGAVGIFVVVAMIGWLGPKRGDDELATTGSKVDSSELYWAEAEIAERSHEMADQLVQAPQLVVTPVAEIVKAYDRGFDDPAAAEGKLVWGEEGALRLVHRHLQTEKPRDGEVWFDNEVDYLYEGVVTRERIREAAENYRSIWPQCWQFLQEPPEVTRTAEGVFEVRVNYVHLALDTRRLRKWQWQRCYHIREADGGSPIITACLNEEVRKTLPLTDAERRFLLGHFCQNYYDAGCATSDLSQLVFLYDPTYYIDEDHTLNEISQSLEHYHSIRPKRQLSLKAMSDIECLEEDLFLIVCLFEAKRDVGYDPVVITDIMQVRFFDDEPHVVYVKPRP